MRDKQERTERTCECAAIPQAAANVWLSMHSTADLTTAIAEVVLNRATRSRTTGAEEQNQEVGVCLEGAVAVAFRPKHSL